MPMLRLRRVGSRHEVSQGDRYVGDIDDSHLRDYVANNCDARFSVESRGSNSIRLSFASEIAERKAALMERNPKMAPDRAFLLAKDAILKERPGLAALYRADVKIQKR